MTFLHLMQNWECVKSIFFNNITLLCNQIGTLFEGDIAFIYIYIYIYIYTVPSTNIGTLDKYEQRQL